MAQLPPKVPNIVPQYRHNHSEQQQQQQQQQWHDFMHPHHEGQGQGQNPPWVDEFMEFSATKRGFHRRSVSESSVAFVEAGRCRKSNNNDDEFDRFDDEQFLSMFSNNDLGGGGSTSTSDHNSTNDDQKKETATTTREEVESTCKGDNKEDNNNKIQSHQGACEGSHNDDVASSPNLAALNVGGNNTADVDLDQHRPMVDPKRVKRILANRQSAQRSRVRKLQYISELERSVTALQSEVSALSPRVAFLDHQRMILNVDNSTLKAKIAALAQDKIFKDAHQEAMKREIERLRHVYYQQNLNKTESVVPPPSTTHPPPQDTAVNENEQLTC